MAFLGNDGLVYIEQKVLVGFLTEQLKSAFLEDYFSGCTEPERERVNDDLQAAVAFCSELDDGHPREVSFGEIPDRHAEHLQKVRSAPMFQNLIGTAAYRFAMADLREVIAVQPNVGLEAMGSKSFPINPSDEEIVNLCLPYGHPFELQVTVAQNQVTFSGFDNNLNGVGIAHQPGGLPTLFPGSRGNWVQVAVCQGRLFLLNGYHRVVKLLAAGVSEIPCIVRDFALPEQMGFGQGRFFPLQYLMGATRPPLIRDFASPAAIRLPAKRMRTTMVATLQVTPLSVPG